MPDQPDPPTTTQVATSLQVSWTAPTANFLPITDYEVQIKDSTGNFAANTALCNPSAGQNAFTDMYCVIPLSVFESAPYSYAVATTIEFKVLAKNSRGWSAASAVNPTGVTAQSKPAQMAAPTTVQTLTNETSLFVQWAALTTPSETGGSTITSYYLKWDKGTAGATWYDIIGNGPTSLDTNITLTSDVSAGTTYRFKVQAYNIHGWGLESPIAYIKAAEEPSQMTAVTTSIDAATGGVTISWTAPHDGSDAIVEYKIEIKQNDGNWYHETTHCVGTSATLLSTRQCTVPMSALTASPLSLAFDALVEVRASARNAFDWSIVSPTNTAGAKIRSVPYQMSKPTVTSLSESVVDLSWTALTSPTTGNSAILSYQVYWDNGGGTPNIQLLDALQTTLQVTGLTGGTTYRFKIRARNIYGYAAAFSDALVVLASDKPDKVDIPSVTIGATDTSVAITWDAPPAHSAAIDGYEIQLLQSGGTYASTSACDGLDAAVISSRQCLVPMTTILSLTSLAVDTTIQVRIRARNANGWGDYSELNTGGATIETVPLQMPAPTFVAASSNNNQVSLSWSAVTGASAGGQNVAITSYVLEWDAGAGGSFSTHQTLSTTSAVSTGLTGGTTYKYRIAAQNKHGVGTQSAELTVLAAQKPDKPGSPTVTQESIYVKIAWAEPTSNHEAIDYY